MIRLLIPSLLSSLLALTVSLCATTASLTAQNPRPSVNVAPGVSSDAFVVRVATEGDRSAIVYSDYTAASLWISISDGRGIDWSPPVRLDSPSLTQAETLEIDSVAMVGDTVYIAFGDGRFGPREIFLIAYDVATGIAAPEVRIDNGSAPGVTPVIDWRLAACAGTSGVNVYVLLSVRQLTTNQEELRLAASHDGGVTFSVQEKLSTGSVDLDAALEIAAHDDTVHIAWADSRHDLQVNDVFYQRSDDGGSTFPNADIQLDTTDGPGVGTALTTSGFDLEVAPPIVAVCWNQEISSFSDRELRASVSADGGNTFSTDNRFEQAPQGEIDIFADAQLAIDPESGNVVVAWSDGRLSGLGRAVFSATSFDSGTSWVETQLTSTGTLGLTSMEVAFHEVDGRSFLAYATSGFFTGELFSLHSLDGGATWKAPLQISDQLQLNGNAAGPLAYNARYANWIHAWKDGPAVSGGTSEVRAGGFRPATLEAVVTPAPTLNFELSGFTGSAPLAAVVLSSSPGLLPLGFGDGRNLGLTLDSLFLLSLDEAFGLLGANVASGAASTPVAPIGLPPGVTIQAVAISFDFSSGIQFDQITDVLAVF